MAEMLEIFDLGGKSLGVQQRDVFYEEIRAQFRTTGKVDLMVRVVRLLLLKPDGRLFFQLRSPDKAENPGMMDKTTGGHVKVGQRWDLAMVAELGEELGIPAFVTSLANLKHDAYSVDLQTIAVLAPVGEPVMGLMSVRKCAEGDFVQPLIVQHYVGFYDGAIWFRDGESAGLNVLPKDAVLTGSQTFNTNGCTQDLVDIARRLEQYLVPLESWPS